jgi:hypothetical protein
MVGDVTYMIFNSTHDTYDAGDLSGVILRNPPKFICIINGRIPMIHRKN